MSVGFRELIIEYRKSGTSISIVIYIRNGVLRREPTTFVQCVSPDTEPVTHDIRGNVYTLINGVLRAAELSGCHRTDALPDYT
jgi:predicted transcriptional regulator